MGEGLDTADSAMLSIVSSANVATGAHAGSLERFEDLIIQAHDKGVVCGIHPGFNDPENFGRTRLPLRPIEITALLVEQISNCDAIAVRHDINLPFLKVHGALANMAEEDSAIANAIAQAVTATGPTRALVGMSGLGQAAAAEKFGLKFIGEIFADRTYRDDGFLTPRTAPNAVIHDPLQITARVLQMIRDKAVITTSGTIIPAQIDTICVHGDTKNAVTIAADLRHALERAGLTIASPLYNGTTR